MRERLAKLRDAGGDVPYPNEFGSSIERINAINEEFASHTRDALSKETTLYRSVAGRLVARRGNFMVIQESPLPKDRIQLYINRKAQHFLDAPQSLRCIDLWDLGDIVTAGGNVRRSGKGDLYLDVCPDPFEPRLVAKSIRPPPEKYHGLKDIEARSRRRYLDLTYNATSWQLFARRAKIIAILRSFLASHGYVEVETPVLNAIPGGANAKPFVTRHEALNQDMFLRISPELYLKRLMVGGMRRVYEMSHSFRNEGISPRHNPEFTMLEFYCAYATHREMLSMLRALFAALVPAPHMLRYGGEEYHFGKDIKELAFLTAVANAHPKLGMSEADMETLLQAPEPAPKLSAYLRSIGIELNPVWDNAKLLLELFEKTVEPKLLEPVFVVDYPAATSPLARPYDDRPWLAQRFEFIAYGIELANGCSELNDPVLQAEHFKAQIKMRQDGDEEAMHYEKDYIEALEYGMPPVAGAGLGVDRLVMLLCNAHSVRDVRLFPHMRDAVSRELPTD